MHSSSPFFLALQNSEEMKLRDQLNARAANIEIWTSESELHFGSDHCNAKNFSHVFDSTQKLWRLCGHTPGKVSSGDTLTVPCIRRNVRMILLRRYVANVTDPQAQCMSFVNMWICRIGIVLEFHSASQTAISEAKQNSSVTVCCRVDCAESPFNHSVKLTHSGKTLPLSRKNSSFYEHAIDHVQPDDAGLYNCGIQDAVYGEKHLRVLYPPKTLTISLENETSCSTKTQTEVKFRFTSSTSDPIPRHECTAFDSNGVEVDLVKHEMFNSSDGQTLVSTWMCHNCTGVFSISEIQVNCSAAQPSIQWNTVVSAKFCDQSNLPFRATILIFTGFVVALVAISCALIKKKLPSTTRPPEVHSSSPFPAERDNQTLQPGPIKPSTSFISQADIENDDDNNCIYVALVPCVQNGQDSNSRPVSDVTEYLEIVGHGD